jgi:hypothetical protein
MISRNVIDVAQGKQLRFLTLTIKTGAEPLSQSLDKIYNAFSALRRRRFWQERVTGGVSFLENKWSEKSNRWHPHFHCLIEGFWIDRKQIMQAWREITGDSFIVDIRMPKGENSVIRYITKYASKPLNNTFLNRPDLLDEAVLALAGRKLAVTFGSWRGVVLSSSPSEDGWEYVAPLSTVIHKASIGDKLCHTILSSLTDIDLGPLLSRAPPVIRAPLDRERDDPQMTFFATWQSDGEYRPPTL